MTGEDRGAGTREFLLAAGAAAALYGFAFLLAGGDYGFVNFDDPAVTGGNPVRSFGTLGAAFTERMAHAWLPLYSLSLGLDNALFGEGRPLAYHLHSVLLHGLNAGLLVLLAARLGLGRRAALAAGLLFAVHPALTESVAWVASRKDLLSFLLAASAALVFLRAEGLDGGGGPRRPALHGGGALLLGLALLAKGTVLVLPVLLLLAVLARAGDPAARRRGLLGTLPYFVVAGLLTAVHLRVAVLEGTAGVDLGPSDTTGARAAAGAWALALYLKTLLLPWPLSVEHGLLPGDAGAGRAAVGVLLLAAAAAAAILAWRRGRRGAALAIVGVLAALAPFNGLFPRTSVLFAERYLYLPAAVACGLLGHLLTAPSALARLLPPAAPVILAFSVLTLVHLPAWRNSTALWENAVERAPRSHLAWSKLGEARNDGALAATEDGERRKRFEGAAEALDLAARHARTPLEELRARHDLGLALLGAGKGTAALEQFGLARSLVPAAGEAVPPSFRASLEVNRAKAMEHLGREGEAAAALEEFLRSDPSSGAAWLNLGVLRLRAGEVEKAREALLRATEKDPSLVEARLALADLEALAGDFAMAARIAVKAVDVAPESAPAMVKAGEISMLLGQPLKAEEWFRKALARAPADAGARRGLAGALSFRGRAALGEGRVPEALRLTREAVDLDPKGAEAWFAAGEALRASGDGTGALEAFHRAGENGGRREAAAARAAILLSRALAARAKGDGAAARAEMERALAEGAEEIRTGARRAPLREELRWIPPAPAGGDARPFLLDGLLALSAGEDGPAAVSFGTVIAMEGARGTDPAGPLHAPALVLRSRARLAGDDLEGAVADLEALAAAKPADARARFLLGHTLSGRSARRRSEGRTGEAAEDGKRATALLEGARGDDPSLVEASIALAEMRFVEGRVVEAIRELNAVLAADPDRVEAHLVLGNIMKAQFTEQSQRSFLDEAEEQFRRVLALDPGEARALAGLGEMAVFSNRPKEALAYALRALNADPDLPAARSLAALLFVRVGKGHLDEGNADAALEMAKRAEGLGGETAPLCLLRAEALRKKGEWAQAGSEVERARTLDPESPEVKDALAAHYRDVGYAFLLHRRRDQAEEAFRRAVAAGSDRVDLSEAKRFLESGGEISPAAVRPEVNPAVADALDRAMEEARTRHVEGAALLKAGKNVEAAEAFRASLRSFETSHARFGLGFALAAEGDGEGAEREYRRSVADDPSFADGWLNLGAVLYRRGEDAGAEEAYLAYLRHAPREGAEEVIARVEAIVEVLRRRRR